MGRTNLKRDRCRPLFSPSEWRATSSDAVRRIGERYPVIHIRTISCFQYIPAARRTSRPATISFRPNESAFPCDRTNDRISPVGQPYLQYAIGTSAAAIRPTIATILVAAPAVATRYA